MPVEVILLIVEQLRDIRRNKESNPLTGRSGMEKGWQDLGRLCRVNKAWWAACHKLWQQERHLSDSRVFPKLLTQLNTRPNLQETVTRLYIKV